MTVWYWLTASEAHVGSAVIITALVVFIGCFLAFARDEQRKDAQARIDLAPLYRDHAGHAAWVAEFQPEKRAEP